jgi:hypothetical protein
MQSGATRVDGQWILALDFYKHLMPKLILLSEAVDMHSNSMG